MRDDLGDRVREYEVPETTRRLDPARPVIARVDGRSFSRVTRDLVKPFDARLHAVMVETTGIVVSEASALVGYTQSDETSLAWAPTQVDRAPFGGRLHKLTSTLASLFTSTFVYLLSRHAAEEMRYLAVHRPHFDCRVFQPPSMDEAANALRWREHDAHRNAVLGAAQVKYGHFAIANHSVPQLILRLRADGIEVDHPERGGTYVRMRTESHVMTSTERAAITSESHRPPVGTRVLRRRPFAFHLARTETHESRLRALFGELHVTH